MKKIFSFFVLSLVLVTMFTASVSANESLVSSDDREYILVNGTISTL